MSYGYMVWAVDLDRFVAACGSGDRALADRFGNPDLQTLILGQPLDPARGSAYAYALKGLCDYFGEFLDNSALYPSGLRLPDQVDAALKSLGITTLSLSKLAYGRLPVSLPPLEEWPGTGHLSAAAVVQAAAEFAAAPAYSGGDWEVGQAIACIQGWVERARDRGWGLVSYFH